MRYLWTNTYATAAADVPDVLHDWRIFVQKMRRHDLMHGSWARCVERGSKGTQRLHLHWATSERIEHAAVAELWGRGFVFARDHAKGETPAAASARVGGYLAKYVGKEGLGSRSYDVARGFQPVRFELEVASLEHGGELVANTFATEGFSHTWASTTEQNWRGPECEYFMWEGGEEHAPS